MVDRDVLLAHAKPIRPLPRRFYETASVGGDSAPFSVELDRKPLRTPLKALLRLPTRGLAEAIANEWQAQGQTVDPFSMPLTKLANTATDRVGPNPKRIIDEIVKFAGSDLVCYRADEPTRLRERQADAWDPLLTWAQQRLDARFRTVSGVMFLDQPAGALSATRTHLDGQSSWVLTAIHNLTTLTGSVLLALMIGERAMSGDDGWAAAHVDEDWQIEHWGVDGEAQARRAARRREFDAAIGFMTLLRT